MNKKKIVTIKTGELIKKSLIFHTRSPIEDKIQENPKLNTHLASPSSRMTCSSAVQSIEIPGLCFMAPELSGGADTGVEFPLVGLKDDEAWLGS